MRKDNDRFYQGFSVAIAALIKRYDMPTVAKNIMKENGITLKNLKDGDCEKYDMDIIRKAIE